MSVKLTPAVRKILGQSARFFNHFHYCCVHTFMLPRKQDGLGDLLASSEVLHFLFLCFKITWQCQLYCEKKINFKIKRIFLQPAIDTEL